MSIFFIAEIGINHNGSIKLAKRLIDLAKKYNERYSLGLYELPIL